MDSDYCLGSLFPEEPPKPERPRELTTFETKVTRRTIELRLLPSHRLWGHVLWNAGKVCSDWIEENSKDLVAGKSVLEFGSASALPSITAALNGASFVCATDYPDDSLIENIHQNLQANLPDGSRFSAIGHQWGKPVSPILEANGGEPYDLILMADVVFNHTEQRSLLKSCVSCLAPGGVAFVSFSPHRPHLYEKDMRFFEIAREEFSLEVAQLPSLRRQVMFEMDPGDAELRATVFCFLLRRSS